MMKSCWRLAILASSAFCLLLIVAASPSSACYGGQTYTCDGVACAVPGNPNLQPGYCTPAQKAAGGYEVFTTSNCGGSLAGGCNCYLPSYFQITRGCSIQSAATELHLDEPEVSLASLLGCAESPTAGASAMTAATTSALQ